LSSHHQAGPLLINIQSKLRTATDLCKNVSFIALFGISGNLYTIPTQSDMCAYTHILHNTETLVEQNKQKNWDVNVIREGNLSARHFGRMCHSFTSPALQCDRMAPAFNRKMGKLETKVPYITNKTGNVCVFFFSTLSHKWYNIQKEIIEDKMCVLISSTSSV